MRPWHVALALLFVSPAAAAVDCGSYTLYSLNNTVSSSAGSLDANLVGNPAGCTHNWTATSDSAWLTASPGSGTTGRFIHVSWPANYGAQRTGHVTVVGEGFTPPMVLTVKQLAFSGTPCTSDAQTLCLYGGRFRVTAAYSDYGGGHGTGQAVPLTSDTGYFWFFTSANVEAVLKMVSFCGGSGGMAVYATGLTDLGVVFTVTDVATSSTRTYTNALGTPFALVRDAPFTCLSRVEPLGEGEASGGSVTASYSQVEPLAACTADATSLCLYGGRFRVTAAWKDYSANTGPGHAVALTSDTGYFWFFDSANVEAVIKIVDFCGPSPNAFAVYANGLTDVQVTLNVTDTETGRSATYLNALGHPFVLIRDAAFPCP